MSKTYSNIAVERATTFLNKLNAHYETAKVGNYLVKFALIDGLNFRTIIFDHLLPTGKYGLLHFSISPLKVWHSIKFKPTSRDKQANDTQFRVAINFDKFNVLRSKDWRNPKVVELQKCFFDCLAGITQRGLKDGSLIKPDKFRFLLHLGGLRLPSELTLVFKPLRKKAKLSVANSTALQDIYNDFFRINQGLSTKGGPVWITFIDLVRTENLALGLPCLCKVSTLKKDIMDPKVSLDLSKNKEFRDLPENKLIAVNGQGQWRKITPQDFIRFVSSLIYYLS